MQAFFPFPLLLYRELKRAATAVVIFNDYDQLTAFCWMPLLKRLRRRFLFAVMLHDADRDAYLPVKWLSVYSMKLVMKLMHLAFFHEVLPDKPYYHTDIPKIAIPHGIYQQEQFDQLFLDRLLEQKKDKTVVSILGNIRDEKNYRAVIECLPYINNMQLQVIGKPANSGVPVSGYKELIVKLGVQDKVVWLDKFMTDAEFQSAIMVADVVLLYYKSSFVSQSGILNLIAPHKKYIIVSDAPSALRETVKQFGIGKIVPLAQTALLEALANVAGSRTDDVRQAWEQYMRYASWENHAAIAVEQFKNMLLASKQPVIC